MPGRDCPPRPWPALLLLGPTGAGKSPLGDWLERYGWQGMRCHHFDFGCQLRTVAAVASQASSPWGLTAAQQAVVHDCLQTGALLENETFDIARRILAGFAATRCTGPADRLLLNGLPRHVDQARMLAGSVSVDAVLVLECDAATVAKRIRRNSGGDRTDRADDAPSAVRRRLAIYRERTLPLIEFYRQAGARIVRLPVAADTTPAMLMASG